MEEKIKGWAKLLADFTEEELTKLFDFIKGEHPQSPIADKIKPLDGSAYDACVKAHQGQCGTCDQQGNFTPCI